MSIIEADLPKTAGETGGAHLFAPITLRGVTLRNRIGVSPMCMYSSEDGYANDWHVVHLGTRAVGGAALVFTEAAAVEAKGRISPQDLGIWKDEHIAELARITRFIKAQGAVAGIQLAHAGRKASVHRPWEGTGGVTESEGGWQPDAPSAVAFNDHYIQPHELSETEIGRIVESFAAATKRAVEAGFEVIELHGAHGYLMHEFLSPVANQRTDTYGGSFENRARFVIEVADATRAALPDHLPLFARFSATDWLPEGVASWRLEDTVRLAALLRDHGVDVMDVSSGGMSPQQKVELRAGYQVPFADAVRNAGGMRTAAVGLITEPEQANQIVQQGEADIVLLGRELLRDPYWPQRAARELGQTVDWPIQYDRAR